jgi:hypothetical protein
MLDLFRRARWIVLVLLAVYFVSFGAGYAAGKLGIVEMGRLRLTGFFKLNRTLDYSIPVLGPRLERYRTVERPMLARVLSRGRAVSTMLTIFLNNGLLADAVQILKTAAVLPLALYPYGRFVLGLVFGQARSGYRVAMIALSDFGAQFMVVCGTLVLLLWTAFYRRFRFPSRGRGFFSGLKIFGVFFAVSLISGFVGAYMEMMNMLGVTLR